MATPAGTGKSDQGKPNQTDEESTFFERLQEEQIGTRDRRFKYQVLKLSAVGSSVSIGALLFEKMNTAFIFCVAPFLAITIDIFISSESFTLKRLATFIKHHPTLSKGIYSDWERFVELNQDKLAKVANVLATTITAVGSSALIFITRRKSTISHFSCITFAILCATIIIADVLLYYRLGHYNFRSASSNAKTEDITDAS